MLDQKIKDRISEAADNISRIPEIQQGYQMGAEAEAERAAGLVMALEKCATLATSRRWDAEGEIWTTAHEALTKYNNSK